MSRPRRAPVLASLAAVAWLASPLVAYARDERAAAEFDVLWHALRDRYAYLEESGVDWDCVRASYRPRFVDLGPGADTVPLLERVLDELCDAHIQLNFNTSSSWRLVPSGSDLRGRFDGDDVVIDAVRAGSPAEAAGVVPGMRVLALREIPIDTAVERRFGECRRRASESDRDWALQSVLAGRRDEPRVLEIELDGVRRRFAIDESKRAPPPSAPLSFSLRDDGIGVIAIHDSLGDDLLVPAFDDALAALREAKALVLDLRDTPRGGNTTVARSLLGRFVDREAPYQKHELVSEARAYGVKRSWLELVSPRGPFVYSGRVAVLVGAWTGSMGEGVAIAFDGLDRGTVIGARMAGLKGALARVELDAGGVVASFPAEKVFHVDGSPRERFVPRIVVDLAAPEHRGKPDPTLDVALAFLAKETRKP